MFFTQELEKIGKTNNERNVMEEANADDENDQGGGKNEEEEEEEKESIVSETKT